MPCSASAWGPATAARSTRPRRPPPRRCSRRAWTAPVRSCCRSPAGATSRCGGSTRRPRRSPREVNEAAKAVSEAAHPDANIIFGAMVDEKLDDQVWVTVVATGYSNGNAPRRRSDEPGATRRLEEPRGEPRVRRREPARTSGGLADLDVPEFIPRG